MKTITREQIIEDVVRMSNRDVDWWTVKQVLENLDFVVYQYLNGCISSHDGENPREDIKIKLIDGISIDRKYVEESTPTKGLFKGQVIPEHYNVKANVSEHYAKKVNDKAKKYIFHTSNHS